MQVVSQYVQPGTREGVSLNVVDYEGIRYCSTGTSFFLCEFDQLAMVSCSYSKNANFTAFINGLAKVNTSGFDHDSTYAFFMNVYNALAIKMIIDHPCAKSLFRLV